MKKLLALISARNKEFYRDRSAMIWTLVFPFIVLMGFTYGYGGRKDPILRVAAFPTSVQDSPVLRTLKETPGLEVVASDDSTALLKKVERYDLDLAVTLDSSSNSSSSPAKIIYSRNKDSDKGLLAERLLLESIHSQPEGARPAFELKAIEGRHLRYSDWLLPGLLAMNIMFGSMFGVGYVIVRYRKNGVLKRLRATPLSAFQFLAAQVVSRMLLMLVTSYMVLGGAMLLIGFKPQGSLIDFGIFLCVSSAAMISVGLVVAARISTEEVAEGVLNLMTWPMIFLSGIWFSVENASRWVLFGSKLMPLTHVVDGLRGILNDGVGIVQLLPQVGILVTLTFVFLGVGSAVFRWR